MNRNNVDVMATLKRLLKEIHAAYPVLFPVVLLCIVFTAIVSSIPGIFIQNIIQLIESLGGNASWADVSGDIIRLISILATLYVLSLISSVVFNQIMAEITQGTLYHMRKRMFAKMQTLPIKYFDQKSHGDIMSYYTNDIDTIRQMISQSIPQILISLITVATVLGIMIYYSLALTLTVVAGVCFMYVLTKYIGGHSRKYFIQQQRSLGKTEGYLEEMIYGQKVVKIFNHEQESFAKFSEVNDQLFDDAEKANTYANVLGPVLNNIGNILYVVVALIGGILVYYNVPNLSISGLPIGISIVVPFLNMTKQFTGNINQVSMQLNSVIMGLAGVQRVFRIMDEASETDAGTIGFDQQQEPRSYWKIKDTSSIKVQGNIRMDHVSFGYLKDKEVISDLSIQALKGQKVALVGATGSGKTTIASLLNRFYDVNSGKILFDGLDVNDIKKSDLRRSVSIVLQDTNLFTATVMENLRYGHLEASDDECVEASKKTGAHEFIMKLPEQYDTLLSGAGDNLSSGQRQLLGISRALLANKPVVILDEATSSIDTRTESAVQKAMDVLMEGRTVFVIAHRLSTVRNSDQILVLDQGRILEQGSHQELLEQHGRYYQLYTGKFELE